MNDQLPPSVILGPRPLHLAIIFFVVAAVLSSIAYLVFGNLAGSVRWVLGMVLSGIACFSLWNSIDEFLQERRNGYLWKIKG
jgi:uncharacterized membrane protein YdjX (TVP38/TMEM64 family)